MSNANRDYAIVYDIKNSSLVLSRPLRFYITDKNTSNIFVRLVTKVSVGHGIDQYTDIEEASNYVLTMRVIKPNNEIKSIQATQHEPESIFQFDLTEDFKDIPGKYICELTISTIVNSRQELITSDPFNYEVKRSILSNIGEIVETEDTTVEDILNQIDVVNSRIDNLAKLVGGSTTGDAELIDIRVAANGKVYDSAGTSVREQFKAVDRAITNLRNGETTLTSSDFRIGAYENGEFLPNSTRRITANIGFVNAGTKFKINPNGQYFYVNAWNKEPKKGDAAILQTGWVQNTSITIKQDCYVAVSVANGKDYANSTDITPNNYAMDFHITFSTKLTERVNDICNNIKLTRKNFVQGGYDAGKMYNSTIRITGEFDAKKGDIIQINNTNGHYICVVLNDGANDNNLVPVWSSYNNTKTIEIPYDGKLYICVATANKYDGSTAITPDDYKCDIVIMKDSEIFKMQKEIASINNAVTGNKNMIDSMITGYKCNSFENYGVENGKVTTSDRRLHSFIGFCPAGSIFELYSPNNYVCVDVYQNDFGDTQSIIETSGWLQANTKYVTKKDGYICLLIANGKDYANSTVIDSSDFDGYVNVKSSVGNGIKEKDLLERAFVSSYNIIGSSEEHIKNFVKLFKTIGYGDSFLFFTDMHVVYTAGWEDRLKETMAYIEQIANTTPISFVLNGGDWLGSYNTQDEALYMLSRIAGTMRAKFGDRGVMLLGNHDTNYQGSLTEEDSENHVENILARLPQSAIDNTYSLMRRKSYFRYETPTFALYCFDTGIENDGVSTDYYKNQVKWFAEALQTETKEHIVLAMHMIYNVEALCDLAWEVTRCSEQYNSKGEYTYDSKTYNYATANGKVAFAIGGHNHADKQGLVHNIPYFLTVNAAGYGTYSSLPFDLCAIDWDAGKLYLYRCEIGKEGTVREIDIIV